MSLKVDASHAEKFNGNGNHENCDIKELINSSTTICRFVYLWRSIHTTQWSTQFKSQSICQLLSNPFKHSNPKVLQLAKCSWIASCGLLYVKLFALYLRALGRRGLVFPSSDPSAAEHLLSYSSILAAELTNLKFCSEINDSCTICHKVSNAYTMDFTSSRLSIERKRFS